MQYLADINAQELWGCGEGEGEAEEGGHNSNSCCFPSVAVVNVKNRVGIVTSLEIFDENRL